MTDRAQFPSSPECGQWETLLADALDGLLQPEDEDTFSAHMAGCKACTALFDEARRGREWLEFLSPEPEVPAGLLDKILAQTGPGQVAGFGLTAGAAGVLPIPQPGKPAIPAWQQPGFIGQVRRFAEPRLLMTAAMAFFSIALTLNLTGVRLGDLRMASFRPAAVRALVERRIMAASFATTTTFATCMKLNRACATCAAPPRATTRATTIPPPRTTQHRTSPASPNRLLPKKTAVREWTFHNSRANLRFPRLIAIQETSLRHPLRSTGLTAHSGSSKTARRIDKQERGAQDGLRKSHRHRCDRLLPELR
jgi:hypothetical protein